MDFDAFSIDIEEASVHIIFNINKFKTCHTTFTTAGQRKNYFTKYKLSLKIENQDIPLEPNPTFLGIKLDPKLSFKPHLEQLGKKLIPKTNIKSYEE